MASLVMIDDPGKGTHMPLTAPVVSVGRDDTCTYPVLDPHVSRRHLQIKLDARPGTHAAGDYRSVPGAFVNGKAILLDTPLRDGDHLRIGTTTLMGQFLGGSGRLRLLSERVAGGCPGQRSS